MSEGQQDTPLNDIGWAVNQMRSGLRVARAGWNGKGMWLALVVPSKWDAQVNAPVDTTKGNPHRLAFVAMKTADNGLVPWLCSQTDLLAIDWVLAP